MAIMHEVTQDDADAATDTMFDFHLCPDPTLREINPIVFRIPRIVPPYVGPQGYVPQSPVRIGSFGFGFHDKGFERLVSTVQSEYDEAAITILMPFNDVMDVAGRRYALQTAKRCRALLYKPGIHLVIKHDFIALDQLLQFLASNTVNAFFYDVEKRRGISSTIDLALAVRRPIAITRCGMFRHISSTVPSICIEDSTIKQIVANGTAALDYAREAWTAENFLVRLEGIFERVMRARPEARVDQGHNGTALAG
jgi:hypothetical protein